MSGSKGSSTTIVKTLPPWVESDSADDKDSLHAVRKYLKWAEQVRAEKETWVGYEEKTYADQTTNEKDGIEGLADRGKNGDPVINIGITYINSVLNGNYLDGTRSEFTKTLENVVDKPKSTFDTIYNMLGGKPYCVGDMSNDNLAQELCDTDRYYDRISSVLYAKNYNSERRRQEHALSYGVEYGKQEVIDAEILRMAGLYAREYNQGSLEDAYKLWYDRQTTKVRRVEVLGNAIRSLVGTHEHITRPYYRPSPMIGIMGGAMAGAAAGFMLSGGNPLGAGIGAIAGSALGFISSNG